MGQVGRRRFLAAACAVLAAPRLAQSQAQKKLPVLGILSPHRTPPPDRLASSPLRVRLRELGWEDGKTLRYEYAYGEGREDRMPALAAALVAKKVDVIWALGPEAAIAAARATSTIPIVFWGVLGPVENGLVESIARPGRNVTGVAWAASPGVELKRMQLLREIAPAGKRLAFIVVATAAQQGSTEARSAFIDATQRLGYEVKTFPVVKSEDLEPAFAAIRAWGAQALNVVSTPLTMRERQRIVDFANDNRLPSAYALPDFVEAGGLVSYAIDWRPTFARSAEYVDRILRGAKPGDLPVDLPTQYVTAVNLKTARAIGIEIPQSILLRADRVIE